MNLKLELARLYVFGDASQRATFYKSLADSQERRESIKDFLTGQVDVAQRLKSKARLMVFKAMLNFALINEDKATLHGILSSQMPQADRMLLNALEDVTPDTASITLRTIADVVATSGKINVILLSGLLLPLAIAFACALSIYADVKTILAIQQALPAYVAAEVFVGSSKTAANFAQFLKDYWPFILIAFLSITAALFVLMPMPATGMRRKLDSYPPFSTYRALQTAKVLPALGVYLQANRLMPAAFERTMRGASPWARSHLKRGLTVFSNSDKREAEAFGYGLVSAPIFADILTLSRNQPIKTVIVQLATTQRERIVEAVRMSFNLISYIFIAVFACLAIYTFSFNMFINKRMTDVLSDTHTLLAKQRAWQASNQAKPAISSTQPQR